MRVLSASGSQLEQDFAFGVLRQALARPLSELDADQRAAVSAGQAAHADAMFDPAARPVWTVRQRPRRPRMKHRPRPAR